jgi:hypothetical protein
MSFSSFTPGRHLASNDPEALEHLALEAGQDVCLARVPVPPPGWQFTDYGMSVDGLEAVVGYRVGTSQIGDHVVVQRLDGGVVMDERPPFRFDVSTWFRMRIRELGIEIGDVEARALAHALDRALDRTEPLPGQPRPDDDQIGGFYRHAIEQRQLRESCGEFEIGLVDGNPFRFALFYGGAQLLEEDFPLEQEGGVKQLLALIAWRVAQFDDIPTPPEQMLRDWYARLEPHVCALFFEQVARLEAEAEAAKRDVGLAGKLRPLNEEFEQGVPEAAWYVQDVIAAGALTYIGGYIGAGKTPTTLRMIRSMLAGESFLGFSVNGLPQGFRVAYLTQEGEPTFLPAAAEAGLNDPALSGRFHVGYFHDLVGDDFAQTVEDAARWLAAGGGGLLVVDTMLDWSKATDENDAATMTAALQPLVVAVQKYKIAAVAVGHSLKGLDDTPDSEADTRHIRGSGAVVSNASVVYVLKKAKPRQDGGVRCLKRVRSRLATTTPELAYTLLDDGELREVSLFEQAGREEEAIVRRLLEVLREAGGRARERDLKRDLHLYGDDFENAVDELERSGQLRRVGTGTKGDAKRLEVVS